MTKGEFKQFNCSDIGMDCGFQVRAKTEEEVMKHAKLHAADAHGFKDVPKEMADNIRSKIKTVKVDY